MSATCAPAAELVVDAVERGDPRSARLARYPVRKNHSVPLNRQGWWSPQLSPPSPWNAALILSMSMNMDPNAFIPRATNAGDDSSASAIAASSDSS